MLRGWIVWALRDLVEQKVDFEETWAILYEAFVTWDDIGVVVTSVEERFASSYYIVEKECCHGLGNSQSAY